MACLQLLVVAVAAHALAVCSAAETACGERGFRCHDQQCIKAAAVCDGLPHCDDSFDEAACEEPYTTLAVGKSVSVRAEFEAHHWTMYALVCNATECSRLEMGRNGSDRTRLVFEPATGCGWPLWRQCRHQKYIGKKNLRPATYELVLQRQDSKLAVWQSYEPDNVGLVNAPDGGLIVRLRTWHNHDFRPVFGAPTSSLDPEVFTVAVDATDSAQDETQSSTSAAGRTTSAPNPAAALPVSGLQVQASVRPLSWWRRHLGADSSPPAPALPSPAEYPSLRATLADMSVSLAALRAESSAQRDALADLAASLAALRTDFRAFASWAEQQQQQQRQADERTRSHRNPRLKHEEQHTANEEVENI